MHVRGMRRLKSVHFVRRCGRRIRYLCREYTHEVAAVRMCDGVYEGK